MEREIDIKAVIEALVKSKEPAIRLKTRLNVLGHPHSTPEVRRLQLRMKKSPQVEKLLSGREPEGAFLVHPYTKWRGAHWVLSILADLCYPAGDETLKPLLDQSYEWLLSKEHWKSIRTVDGRVRRCASQEGNCIYYSVALGLADARTEELVERLLRWQWPDGGWNCDKHPEAIHSSFNETLIPLRGLAYYARASNDSKVIKAVERASEVFLQRRLFKRLQDDSVIDRNFVLLHYPCYWHYDILFALKVMGEAGRIDDPRCAEALDLLVSKQLADGGFPAEARYYHFNEKKGSGYSLVDWGGTSKVHLNEFVTVDALSVLRQAGRLVLQGSSYY